MKLITGPDYKRLEFFGFPNYDRISGPDSTVDSDGRSEPLIVPILIGIEEPHSIVGKHDSIAESKWSTKKHLTMP